MLEDLNDLFPNLSWYRITSPPSLQYNCVAWALEIANQWLSHDRTWPDSVPRSLQADALAQVFATMATQFVTAASLSRATKK